MRWCRAAVTAGILVSLASCSTAADKAGGRDEPEPLELSLVSVSSGLSPPIGLFMQEVERLSESAIAVDYAANFQAGDPQQEEALVEAVRDGEVEMAWVGARVFDRVGLTSFQALHAPFLVDSYGLQDRVFAAGVADRMLAPVAELGLTPIGVLPGPLRKITGATRPFVAPEDFVDQTVGTSGGALAEQTFRELGATPQLVPSETSFDGLDGLDYQLSAVSGNRLYESAQFVTANVNLWPRPLVILMNTDRFKEMTPEQQQLLRRAAASSIPLVSEASQVEEVESASALCLAGINVVEATDGERDALRAAVEPVYAALEADQLTRAYLDEIRALKDEADEPPDSFDCPDRSATVESAGRLIDGVYRATTSADELRAAGDPRPVPENYGDWVLVFDRGRFAFTQETEEACTWGHGAYVVVGEVVEWSMIDGGGIAPTGAVSRLGEHFVFGWTFENDNLTLTAVAGAISPTTFMVEPWRRTDAAPTLDVFSARCPPPADALDVEESPTGTPIDGTWEISLTRNELVAAGGRAEEVDDPVAWGTYRMTLYAGRFSFIDPTSGRITDTGTYVVDGDELILTHAAEQGGAVFHLRWSLYRDALTFELVPGAPDVWTGMIADVWQRIDEGS